MYSVRRMIPSLASVTVASIVVWTSVLSGPQSVIATKADLGDVHFPTSCTPAVQPQFDLGVALLHSFEFREAEASFRQVEKEDPKCLVAAWGLALSTTERSGANAPQKDLKTGWSELQPWLTVPAGTKREQMYVEAVHAMYQDYATVPGDRRWQNYLTRMEQIRQIYPSDINASLFYGLGLTWTAGSGEQGLAQRKRALAIFLPIFEKYPNNPGAAHYIIHAADTAELAHEALPAARKYASIAPDSPHALHMPSHIFNRLGYWKDSIATNQASARVAAQWISQGRAGIFDQFHALNNIEYGYLQLGDDEHARQIMQTIDTLAKGQTDPWLSVDARIYFDLDRHDWQDAAQIQPPPSSRFEENFDAYWIQTMGAARSGQVLEAEHALEEYRQSEAAYVKEHGWGDILGVALTEAEAWTMFARGQHEEAVAHLRTILPFERDHPMYYADVLPRPAGEMLGDMLLQMGKPAEALTCYRDALQLAPNRLDSLLGAMKAAALSGDPSASKKYADKIASEGGWQAART